MNILMVYPTKIGPSGLPIKYRKSLFPPLPLAILDGLTPKQHRVKIVNEFVEEIDFSASYDLVAISAMTNQIPRAYQIAGQFKKLGVPVVLGGVHATVLHEEASQHVDSVVVGEVDPALWGEILGDAERKGLKTRYQLPDFPDLQELIIPKWDNLNMSIYPRRLGSKLPVMPMYTTRGCPFGCSFCSVSKFFGKSFRTKPIDHVLQEIDSMGTRDIFFVDDNITVIPEYSRDLFSALRGRNVRWYSQISTTIMKNPDLIDRAGESGCGMLFIGIESVSRQNLSSVGKGFNNPEQYQDLFERLRKAHIFPMVSIIFGFDEDTPEVFEQTLQFLKKNRIGYSSMCILTPLPGTNLFAKMDAEGRILTKDWAKYDLNHVVFQPKKMSATELYDQYWKASQKFYSRVGWFRRTYHNVFLSRNVLNQVAESLFYQLLFSKNTRSHEHPFSAGLLRRT